MTNIRGAQRLKDSCLLVDMKQPPFRIMKTRFFSELNFKAHQVLMCLCSPFPVWAAAERAGSPVFIQRAPGEKRWALTSCTPSASLQDGARTVSAYTVTQPRWNVCVCQLRSAGAFLSSGACHSALPGSLQA